MAISTTRLTEQLKLLHAHFPFTVTIDSINFTVNKIAPNLKTLEQRIGDNIEQITLTLAFTLKDFADNSVTVPKRGEKMTFEGVTYRIRFVEILPDGIDVHFHLGNEFEKG